MAANIKPLHGVEFFVRHSELRKSFSLQRAWGENKTIILRLEPTKLTFIYEKGGVRCEVGCPIRSTTAMEPDGWWCLETDTSVFRKFLCNEAYWSLLIVGPNVLARFKADPKLVDVDKDEVEGVSFDIDCGSMSLRWPFFVFLANDRRLEAGLGVNFNAQAVGSTLETALPFADRRGDERHRAIEYAGNTALAASVAGARVVESDLSTDIALRVDRAYATGLCALLRHMDPTTAQAWRVGSTQHFSDQTIHVAVDETAHTQPNFATIFGQVPLFQASVALLTFAIDVQRILAQCIAKASMLNLTIDKARAMSLSTPVRGGIAKLTFAETLGVCTATDGTYEAKVDGESLQMLAAGLLVSNESARILILKQGMIMTTQIDKVIVKTLIPFAVELSLITTETVENTEPDKGRAKWGACGRSLE